MRAAVLLLLLVNASACEPDRPSPDASLNGSVHRSCAPWDGPALRLEFRDDSGGPALSLYLYRHSGGPTGRYQLGGTDSEGSATWCRAEGDCESPDPAGQVWIDRVTEGQPVTGTIRVREPGGTILETRFTAEWGEPDGPCG